MMLSNRQQHPPPQAKSGEMDAGVAFPLVGNSSSIGWLPPLDWLGEVLSKLCERRKFLLLNTFSGLYFAGTCWLASQKTLWNDELFTFYISTLPSVSDIWSAVLTGGEQIPPLFHIITRASLFFFGTNELAIRVPEVLGFWVMSLCLFSFVSKRSSALFGFVAMLFPLVTQAYHYAYEARPYALVLGFAGLSLVCWQSATERRNRKYALMGLTLSLAAAVSNHYYAIFLVVPFAIGEAARSIARRRIDLPIWAAIAFGIVPLLIFLPLIQRARSASGIFWAQPQWQSIVDFYYFLLTPALLSLLVMLTLATFCSRTRLSSSSSQGSEFQCTVALHEICAAFGFIAIPLVAVVVAIFVTGAFTERYALTSVIGFSSLFAFGAHRLLYGRAIMGACLVAFLLVGFIETEIKSLRSIDRASVRQVRIYELLGSHRDEGLPIIASDLHTFLTLAYYAPPDIISRVVYLADPQISLRVLGHSSVDKGILDLKPWFRLQIEEYDPYVASQKQFLVYVALKASYERGLRLNSLNWILSKLTTTDKRIELRNQNKDGLLFLVTSK